MKFKTGVIVVLDLGAERQMDPVFHQRDFILHESAEPLPRDLGREKGHSGSVADVVLNQPVAQSPDDVVPLAQGKTVLEIDIVGVEVFGKGARNVRGGSGRNTTAA